MTDYEKRNVAKHDTIIVGKDNLVIPEGAPADTADADEIKQTKAATEPDKFKDYKTLLKAYTSLEAEFTRRSQRLKELENANKECALPDGVEAAPSPVDEKQLLDAALSSERVKDAIIRDYLETVYKSKTVPLLMQGSGVSAPRVTPKSVAEAGRLAQEFLKN